MPHCQSMDEATVVVWVTVQLCRFPIDIIPSPSPTLCCTLFRHSLLPLYICTPLIPLFCLPSLSLPPLPPYIRLPSSTSPFSPATDRVQQCVTGSTGQGGGASNHLDPTHLNLLSCYSVSCPLLTEDEESGNLYSATCVFYRGTITKTMTIIYST